MLYIVRFLNLKVLTFYGIIHKELKQNFTVFRGRFFLVCNLEQDQDDIGEVMPDDAVMPDNAVIPDDVVIPVVEGKTWFIWLTFVTKKS